MEQLADRAAARRSIRLDIVAHSQLSASYVAMNMLSAVLATYGLFANSAAVVIGAMIVALLLGPIVGLALGVTDDHRRLFKIAGTSLLVGVLAVYVAALVIGFIHRGLPLTNEILARTNPSLLDVMIALAGGAAGAYATVKPRLGVALVGVAVATALVPPLSASALLVARGEFELGWHALLLAITNIVAIQFAASTVLMLTGYRERVGAAGSVIGWARREAFTVVTLALLGTVFAVQLRSVVAQQLFETRVRAVVTAEITSRHPLAFVDDVRFDTDPGSGHLIVRAVVRTVDPITKGQVGEIEDHLPRPPSGRPIELRLRLVSIEVMTRNGALAETGPANG